MAVSIQVVFDCADPHRLATFWAQALGYQIQDPPEGYASWEAFLTAQGVPEEQWNSASAIVDPAKSGPRIFFQRVPEEKVVKNRVHLDLNLGGGLKVALAERRVAVDAAAEHLVGLGASWLRHFDQRGEYWVVMQDPEGNEFCVQ